MSNVYEGLFIFDSNRYGRDPAGVSGQIAEAVEKAGGEMLVSRLWEERRLAYPVNGQRKGTYWLSYFRVDGKQLTGIEREFQLSDSILRCLMIKVEPRIVDALVSHARSTGGEAGKGRRPDDGSGPTDGGGPKGPGAGPHQPPAGDVQVEEEMVAEVAETGS